jgi:hypothetical protein
MALLLVVGPYPVIQSHRLSSPGVLPGDGASPAAGSRCQGPAASVLVGGLAGRPVAGSSGCPRATVPLEFAA